MKLSKEDLKRLVWHSQGGLNDCDSLAWLELIDGILNGRYDEPLEIEGYIQEDHFADAGKMDWIKFDTSNPKTFPPKSGEYIVAIEGRSTSTTRKYSAQYFEFFAPEKITHWRPLPEPPVKTEEGK